MCIYIYKLFDNVRASYILNKWLATYLVCTVASYTLMEHNFYLYATTNISYNIAVILADQGSSDSPMKE